MNNVDKQKIADALKSPLLSTGSTSIGELDYGDCEKKLNVVVRSDHTTECGSISFVWNCYKNKKPCKVCKCTKKVCNC